MADVAARTILVLLLITSCSLLAPPAFGSQVADRYLPVETAASPKQNWVVRSGEHFWSIATSHVGDTLGHPPTAPQVVEYWKSLVDANLEVIRSGNPDLIHPGEVLELP